MIFCKELNRRFSSKKELFAALKDNKDDIIAMKKAAVKSSDAVFYAIKDTNAEKSEGNKEPLKIGDVVKNVINSTRVIDSHRDLHIDGIWTKSVNEKQGKIFHAVNHNLDFSSLVGYPKSVKMEVAPILWKHLGLPHDGYTEALIFNTTITDKTNPDIFKAYRDNEPVQHSVSMEYVKMMLAIDEPEDEDYKEYYANYVKYKALAVNPEKAEELGYFWVVSEAKIHNEGSSVLLGSNHITPYLGYSTETQQPDKATAAVQPEKFNVKEAIRTVKLFN